MNWIGGGIPESRRAIELSELLGVCILPSQVVCHWSENLYLLSVFVGDSRHFYMFVVVVKIDGIFGVNCFAYFILMQVVQGHSPFKTLLKRYISKFGVNPFGNLSVYSFAT